jgi:long-chain acyl-CoA synthetase
MGRWSSTTWAEWNQRARSIAAFLLERGVAAGDRVALLCSTRQAWFEVDVGILLGGAVTVSLYPNLPPHQHLAQLRDAGARWIFAENALLAAPLVKTPPPDLEGVVVVDRRGVLAAPDERGRRALDVDELREQTSLPVLCLADLFDAGRARIPGVSEALDARIETLTPSSPAGIVYSSGTDGDPKGVLLTHGNFLFEIDALAEILALGPDDEQLLFLPMAHIFARILEMAQLRVGYLTTFSEGPAHLFEELPEIEPTFLGAVPRFFEQFHARVLRSLEHQRIGAMATSRAVELGVEVAKKKRRGEPVTLGLALQHKAAEELILARLRAAFGQRLRFAFSGGAPLAPSLAEWFGGLGVEVLEGYGLTETTSATHVNTPGRPMPGYVGRALRGVEVQLSPEREVLLRGPNVFAGYWNRPDLTRLVLDEDGWFHTGDEGVIEDGLLRIVGRKKELLVTSGGHKVAPQPLEAALQQSRWIQKAVVLGEGRSFVTALLSLREEAVEAWARQRQLPVDLRELAHVPELRAAVQAEIDAFNGRVASYERIRGFVILGEPLTVGEGELTPTGKLRRDRIHERFQREIEAMYPSAG